MNGEVGNGKDLERVDDDVDISEDDELALMPDDVEPDDNVGDISVEINVEELVAKIEATDDEEVHRKAEVRRRLEMLRDEREREFDSTFNFNLDDEVT